jgi:nucleoside-diphosphate-sugar epimerase
MSFLVTGAAGFIGSRLCRELKASGAMVRAMDLAQKAGPWDEFVTAELGRGALSASALTRIDTVFHLAGKVHALSEVKGDDAEYFRINTEGTRELLVAAKAAGVKRFVFFSTVKAMSGKDEPVQLKPMDESIAIEPDTPYGRSKLEAEKLVLNGGFVPEPVVLRLCMVYGAGAKGNMQKMLQAVAKRRFPPIPEFANRRSIVHVADVIQAALLAAGRKEASGQVFIVSDGKTYSTRQMYECLCRAVGRNPGKWVVPLWVLKSLGLVGDGIGRLRGRRFMFDSDALEKLTGCAWFNSAKIEATLGFKPQFDLEMAMPEMVAELKR